MLPRLNFPPFAFKIEGDRKKMIFDEVRKKYLVLTPEEWVRQHMVKYITESKGFPKGFVGLEISLQYNKQHKRADIVIYGPNLKPEILVECKAPHIKLENSVIEQTARYYSVLSPKLIILTNGMQHVVMQKNIEGTMDFLQDIPFYERE